MSRQAVILGDRLNALGIQSRGIDIQDEGICFFLKRPMNTSTTGACRQTSTGSAKQVACPRMFHNATTSLEHCSLRMLTELLVLLQGPQHPCDIASVDTSTTAILRSRYT